MTAYITVAEVDTALGTDWAATNAEKIRAVMITNVWLTNLNLPDATDNTDLQEAILLAGLEIVQDTGNLYQDSETGVLSETVSAQSGTSVSNTYTSNHTSKTAAENLALAILKPWLNLGFDDVMFLVKL